ncbi:MAG: glycosyltransferase [Clostridia bacterium]|nr:glycosyltransferase [Clostridia bacterium]
MTILKQFYNYVKANDSENEWIFLLGDPYLDETDRIKIRCFPEVKSGRVRKVFFDCFSGKKVISSLEPDIVVSLQNIMTFGLRVPQAIYIHQSLPFQDVKRFSFFKKAERRSAVIQHIIGRFIKASAKRADKVFVQTEWMREAVSRSVGIDEDRIGIAFPEIDLFSPGTEKFGNDRFFYPTNGEIYKDVDVIVQACDLLNDRGIRDFTVRLTLPEGTVRHPNIVCVGRLDRGRMQEEYNAGTLLFPSYIETVGLPLLEARSCGTLIVASDTPFAGECLAGYPNAYLFPVHDGGALAGRMAEIINGRIPLKADTSVPEERPSWDGLLAEIRLLAR